MYGSLSEYIDRLEREGELVRVTAAVDPVFEIAEITDRMAKSPGGGKALLFEHTGTAFPVLTNLMGSDRRIALALGVESLDEIAERIESLLGEVISPKERFADKLRMLPLLHSMSRWLPRKVRGKGRCQQVVLTGEEACLGLLPVLKCWPCDGGRFVTLPLVNTLDPDTGVRNVGMYRMQVTGEHTTGMHWHVHKTGERHYRAYKRRGERMPVSVCLGGDPAYTYAATAPMPDNMDEYLLAGFLRRRPVKLVKCLTNSLWVPEDCDFVIEGFVDPAQEKFLEGPFGDHTGFYSLEDYYPEFHVTAITHRRGAVYPATVVGVPPQEDAYIAKATERIFLAPIRLALQPEVRDLYMPPPGVAHNLALVSIDKTYEGQALKVAASMWGAGQMMFNKILFVAPAETALRDPAQVARLLCNAVVAEDVLFGRGVLDVLDHATATPGTGGKMAFDLTAGRPDRKVQVPEQWQLPPEVADVDASLAEAWGAVVFRALPDARPSASRILADNGVAGVNYAVVADVSTERLTPAELLWFAAGNTDPGRDVQLLRGETFPDGLLVVDARMKRPGRPGYPARTPNVVASDRPTVVTVDMRWGEYGLGAVLPSPSVRYADLLLNDKAGI